MPRPDIANIIEATHGFAEVDGIPLQVGQCHREGFFQLINAMDGGMPAYYRPSYNKPNPDVYGHYEPWPAIPQNTLSRR